MRDTSYLRHKKSVKTQCSQVKQTGFDDRLGASLLSHCTEGSCCLPSVAPCVFVSFMLRRKEPFYHTSWSQTGYFSHFYRSDPFLGSYRSVISYNLRVVVCHPCFKTKHHLLCTHLACTQARDHRDPPWGAGWVYDFPAGISVIFED